MIAELAVPLGFTPMNSKNIEGGRQVSVEIPIT
jgi:hypothetical protein